MLSERFTETRIPTFALFVLSFFLTFEKSVETKKKILR